MLPQFIDTASLIIIFLPLLAAYLASSSPAQGTFLARQIVLEVALIGVFIGAVAMLAGLNDLDALGPATAILLLVVVYGFLVFGIISVIPASNSQIHSASLARRIIAVFLFLTVVMFAIASVEDFFIYLYLDAFIYVVISMAVIGMVRRSTGASDMLPIILSRLPHIGLFGLFLGLIPALGNIADHQSIGPALAFGYLSFLYAGIASVGYKLANPSITNGIKPIGWPFVCWTLVVLLTSGMLILASLQLSTT
ncbi:MAG: hypothetical protein ACPHGW_10840 [Pseudohongiellaceae bacterium]